MASGATPGRAHRCTLRPPHLLFHGDTCKLTKRACVLHVGVGTFFAQYAKYDDKDMRTESLDAAGSTRARMQMLALTAARVKADRKAAAEAANKKARASALKAKVACHGSAKCEDVLNQVMGIFGQPSVDKAI